MPDREHVHHTGFLAREKRRYVLGELLSMDVATLAARLNEFDDAIAAPIAHELWRRCGYIDRAASAKQRMLSGVAVLYCGRCQTMLNRLRRVHFARLIIEGASATPGLPPGSIGLLLPPPHLPGPRDPAAFARALHGNLERYLHPGIPPVLLVLGYLWRIMLIAIIGLGCLPALAWWHFEHENNGLGTLLIEFGTVFGIGYLLFDLYTLQRLRNLALYISFTDEFVSEDGQA